MQLGEAMCQVMTPESESALRRYVMVIVYHGSPHDFDDSTAAVPSALSSARASSLNPAMLAKLLHEFLRGDWPRPMPAGSSMPRR
jgi:hypothetical protein